MIAATGPLQLRQISRDFQGAMPAVGSVAFVAGIIREGLELAEYPEHKHLVTLSDDWLVQQIALVKAVPNDIWIRNGFYPLGEWQDI